MGGADRRLLTARLQALQPELADRFQHQIAGLTLWAGLLPEQALVYKRRHQVDFLGGVAAFDGDVRVGGVGVSGLPGADDDALVRQALAAAGLETR